MSLLSHECMCECICYKVPHKDVPSKASNIIFAVLLLRDTPFVGGRLKGLGL